MICLNKILDEGLLMDLGSDIFRTGKDLIRAPFYLAMGLGYGLRGVGNTVGYGLDLVHGGVNLANKGIQGTSNLLHKFGNTGSNAAKVDEEITNIATKTKPTGDAVKSDSINSGLKKMIVGGGTLGATTLGGLALHDVYEYSRDIKLLMSQGYTEDQAKEIIVSHKYGLPNSINQPVNQYQNNINQEEPFLNQEQKNNLKYGLAGAGVGTAAGIGGYLYLRNRQQYNNNNNNI